MSVRETLERDGFAMLAGVFGELSLSAIETGLKAASARAGLKESRGESYAARNLVRAWPGLSNLVRETAVERLLAETLGTGCGLVRGILFEKPPGRSWFVAWHKDLTIAIRVTGSASADRLTVKSGVPHVEAPEGLLRRMLTVRIHLDEMDGEGGALEVVPGSHRQGRTCGTAEGSTLLRAARGDVLVMRPLLSHRSSRSRPGNRSRRRVIHLEWAPKGAPMAGLEWHDFEPL